MVLLLSQELEGASTRLEDDVRRLRGVVAASTAAQDSLSKRLEEQESSAKASLRQRDEKVPKP